MPETHVTPAWLDAYLRRMEITLEEYAASFGYESLALFWRDFWEWEEASPYEMMMELLEGSFEPEPVSQR